MTAAARSRRTSSPDVKQTETHHTRARILRVAMELFHEKGYTAAGIAEILQRAQANSGSFYYFFRSKEELLGAVLDRYAEILYPDLLEPVWHQLSDPIDRVFALLAKYRELLII